MEATPEVENEVEVEVEVEVDGYAKIAITEYYGPGTTSSLLGVTESKAEAAAWAASYDPDFDDVTGCHRLSSGQSSPTRGEVRQAVALAGNPWHDDDDFGLLPPAILEALPANIDNATIEPALAALGWEVWFWDGLGPGAEAGDGAGAGYYLVRLAD